MRKGQLVGPYEGSVPDKVLAYVEAGVDDLRTIGQELGFTAYELRQSFRHLCQRGYVSIEDNRIKVTP